MTHVLAIFSGIPRNEWIDLGYMIMIPSVLCVGLPLLILWFRP